jgi:ribonuclease P protein component
MRRSEDFRRTVRRGVRAGRRTVVVHALRIGPVVDDDQLATDDPSSTVPLVGFVVSRAVGSAVRRNRVRRRLRHLTRPRLNALGERTLVVVRALPQAATAGTELDSDLAAAWTAALAKLDKR